MSLAHKCSCLPLGENYHCFPEESNEAAHCREGFSTTSLGQRGTATLRGPVPWGIVLASAHPSASPVRLRGAPEGGCLPGFLAEQRLLSG